ncbi:MAG: hypothetical protein ABFS56_19485 [Pseudomonadota bacterium]
MTKMTGKTYGILKRLPHYYNADSELLLPFIEIFGQRLEQTETQLYQVLRAHHVETADNQGSHGYTASPEKRGDLDKIFALYLESLGGTSQLVKMNPHFTVRSFNIQRLARRLIEDQTPFIAYLKAEFFKPETLDMLKRYHIKSSEDISEENIQPQFVLDLLLDKTPITQSIHHRLSPETKQLLHAYDGGEKLPPPLKKRLATDLKNKILRDPSFWRENYKALETPQGDDLVRSNRKLLEAALGKPARQTPSFNEVQETLLKEFNQLLDKDFHPERFPHIFADCISQQEDTDWKNRRCLELAFPHEIEKSYAPYRERLLHLIQVLRQGASTRQGIIDIVAANLGIVGNEPDALAAKAQIEIEEFLPKQTPLFTAQLKFYQTFTINNNNLAAQTPEITILSHFKTLNNIKIVAEDSEEIVSFKGKMTIGEELVFKADSVLHNGKTLDKQQLPTVPPGQSKWRFEAEIVADDETSYPVGRFDKASQFDNSIFVTDAPVVSITINSYQYTYGAFTVIIPWHIQGFTDKFAETADHPRHQILTLVNRVKAAGVHALIAYKQTFKEEQEQSVTLRLEIQSFKQSHDITDHFEIDSRQSNREIHEIADKLILSGRFDYTYFDSLNKFG